MHYAAFAVEFANSFPGMPLWAYGWRSIRILFSYSVDAFFRWWLLLLSDSDDIYCIVFFDYISYGFIDCKKFCRKDSVIGWERAKTDNSRGLHYSVSYSVSILEPICIVSRLSSLSDWKCWCGDTWWWSISRCDVNGGCVLGGRDGIDVLSSTGHRWEISNFSIREWNSCWKDVLRTPWMTELTGRYVCDLVRI